MNKQEAIARLKEEAYKVKPDQEFEIAMMEPKDAWGVVRCYFEVYGEHYPFEVNYLPARLIEENRLKNLRTVVARTKTGDIIACVALFKSSAYSPKVYEYGQMVVLPEYRSTFAALCLQDYVMNVLASQGDIDEVFGEAVCNQLIIQKMRVFIDFAETGLEMGLMPAEAYPMADFPGERVSALLYFQTRRDKNQTVYFPRSYMSVLNYIMSGLNISRSVQISEAKAPPGSATGIQTLLYDFAQVARFNVYSVGEDFPTLLKAVEQEAQNRNMQVRQVFINLGEVWSGWAIALLRDRGYFFGGFLPRWFDTDGLLMQKLIKLPKFASIKLESERARKILDFIRDDLKENPTCQAWAAATASTPPANQ